MNNKHINMGVLTLANIFLFAVGWAIFYVVFKRGSDFPAHILFARELPNLFREGASSFFARVEDSHCISYPMWHIAFLVCDFLLKWTGGICQRVGLQYAGMVAAVASDIYLLLAFNVSRKTINRELSGGRETFYGSIVLALSLIFTGPLYIPAINKSYYMGQGILTTWHSATYLAVMFMAILCFFSCDRICRMGEEAGGKSLAGFSALLLVSAVFKPNFFQMFVPGLALFCLIELIRSKGKNFFWCLKMAGVVLPVCLLALVQFNMSFIVNEKYGGVIFAFMRIAKNYTRHPLLSTVLFIAFPLFVLVVALVKGCADKRLLLVWCLVISGWLQYMCLCLDSDVLWWAADFAWGYYLAVMLAFIVSAIMLWNMGKNKAVGRPIRIAGWMLYGAQFLCGVFYCLNLFRPGKTYMDPLDFSFIQYFF